MASKHRAAIVGLGAIGYGLSSFDVGYPVTHYEAYQRNTSVTLVGTCDPKHKGISGVTHFRDVSTMLSDTNPSVVSICTPDLTHHDVFSLCVGSPSVRHIWLEKPACSSLAESKSMLALAKQQRVRVVVNYVRRYMPFFDRVKKKILGLGSLKRVHCSYTGGTTTNGSHLIDLLHYFVGMPTSVSVAKIDAAHYDAHLHYSSFDCHLQPLILPYSHMEMDFVGEKGRVVVEFSPFYQHRARFYPLEKILSTSRSYLSSDCDIIESSPEDLLFFDSALTNLLSSGSVRSGLSSGVESVRVLSAMASYKNKRISISSVPLGVKIPKQAGEIRQWKS